MLADAVVPQLGEEVLQGALAQGTDAFGRQLHVAADALRQAGLLEHVGDTAHLIEDALGVVAEEALGEVVVDAVEVEVADGFA